MDTHNAFGFGTRFGKYEQERNLQNHVESNGYVYSSPQISFHLKNPSTVY